jgi:hypothetical protein
MSFVSPTRGSRGTALKEGGMLTSTNSIRAEVT